MKTLEVMDLFYIKRRRKYLTENKTWTVNTRKAMTFDKEDQALKFLHFNQRIKADVVGLLSINKIHRTPEGGCKVEFESKEVIL